MQNYQQTLKILSTFLILIQIHWSDMDTVKLCYFVYEYKQNNQRVNWKEIGRKLNRLPNACKSYYQNKARTIINMSDRDFLYLLSLTNFYNNDFQLIQKNYFPNYTVEQLEQIYQVAKNTYDKYKEIFFKLQNGTATEQEEDGIKNVLKIIKEVILDENNMEEREYFESYLVKQKILLNPIETKFYRDIKKKATEVEQQYYELITKLLNKQQ